MTCKILYCLRFWILYVFRPTKLRIFLRHHKLLSFLEDIEFGERYGFRTKLNEEEFSSKLIHIVTIIIFLDPHQVIIVLPSQSS